MQLCIVYLVRHSLNFVGHKQRKEVAADLQKIYRATMRDEAARELDGGAEKWDGKYPTITQAWRNTKYHELRRASCRVPFVSVRGSFLSSPPNTRHF